MTVFTVVFLVLSAAALFIVPRRWAVLPLLIGICYMTLGQGFEIGSFTFTVIRALILVGMFRVAFRGERRAGGINNLDRLILMWSTWAVITSIFHDAPLSALVYRLGLSYDVCGIYFLVRIFCRSTDDLLILLRALAIVIIPVALEMIYEHLTVHNAFSIFGDVPESPLIREGKIRAQGPFGHAILAGTVGALILPLMVGLWRHYRRSAIVAIIACLVLIMACASSGPILSVMAGIGGLGLYGFRHRLRQIRLLVVLSYIGLEFIMKDPAYYIMARIDITGGSTGWFRARLIESAFEHLNEWWLGGTDFTRHWMPTGITWSTLHTDITNHYIKMGVLGGLPLLILFIAVLWMGFSYVGKMLRSNHYIAPNTHFLIWSLGCSLFVVAVTSISISFFDQSILLVYLMLGAIGSLRFPRMAHSVVVEAAGRMQISLEH